MKKDSNILYRISEILSIVLAVVYVIVAVVTIIVAVGSDAAAAGIGAGIFWIFVAVCALINYILCSKARKAPNKTLHIVNIVFGVLGEVWLNVVAAILGLIAKD